MVVGNDGLKVWLSRSLNIGAKNCSSLEEQMSTADFKAQRASCKTGEPPGYFNLMLRLANVQLNPDPKTQRTQTGIL